MWKVGDRVAFDMPGVTYTGTVVNVTPGLIDIELDDHFESAQRVLTFDPVAMGVRNA